MHRTGGRCSKPSLTFHGGTAACRYALLLGSLQVGLRLLGTLLVVAVQWAHNLGAQAGVHVADAHSQHACRGIRLLCFAVPRSFPTWTPGLLVH
jgi:hypothetical protein